MLLGVTIHLISSQIGYVDHVLMSKAELALGFLVSGSTSVDLSDDLSCEFARQLTGFILPVCTILVRLICFCSVRLITRLGAVRVFTLFFFFFFF